MPETLNPVVNTSISLQEFIDFADNNPMITALKCSEYKPEYFKSIADKFAQLALNKNFLMEFLVSEMQDIERFQKGNDFKPSTLLIHKSEDYTLRAVIWLPISERYPPEIFSYFEPHDHSFDFFTVGFWGPGYTTRLYEYDYERVKGIPGEIIDLRFVEEAKLTCGKVMYYYGSRDAHIQYPSDSLTVSLNLLLPKTKPAHRRQYEFEILPEKDKARIVSGNIDRLLQHKTIIDAAIALGDKESIGLIKKMATKHSNEQLRAIAWKALISNALLDSGDMDLAYKDKSEFVQATLAALK